MNHLATAAPIAVGDTLAGKYRVDRILGIGGMGVVVAAMHLDLHELRAIKFMLPEMLADTQAVERFLREARASSRLKSEHVAKVHDVGRLENGAPYMVMEYLEGSDLAAVMKQRGPRPVEEAVSFVLQACEAIAEAHALGIVHRDLKPANLFLTAGADGTPCVKVLDFGISKVMAPPGSGMDMTKSAAILGSPHYMSPEQMRSTRDVDARTDVWALGVILYKFLTGKVPFYAENITQLCLMVVQQEAAPPSRLRQGLPIEFDRIVQRCLEKLPAQRYSNVAELAMDLLPFGNDGARTSVDRIARILGVPTSRASVAALPSQPPMQLPATALPFPHSVSTPLAVAQSGSMDAGTGAGWGKTGAGGAQKPTRIGLLLAAGLAVLVVGLGIGIAVSRRSAAPAAASVVDSASVTPATSAPSPTAEDPAASAGPPAPAASASAAPSPRSDGSKAAATKAPTTTKAAKADGAMAQPKPAPAGPQHDPFGDGRR